MKKIGLLSDTHGFLDERIYRYFENCDEIWHAGDFGTTEVADKLSSFKPLRGVFGNIDGGKLRVMFPEILNFKCENVPVMMIHIGGRPYVYPPAVTPVIKENRPAVFICGHSHILRVQYDKRLQMLYLNPGAAGKTGFHKVRTLLRFSVNDDKLQDMEAIELGPRA